MILLIDNYDSFVYNLARYFERLGHATLVVRNTAIDAEQVESLRPAAIVLSPGPCTPERAGCTLGLVRRLHTSIPLLGICLGHQTIAAALGGRVVRAKEPVHGRTSPIHHNGRGLFARLPSPLVGCRYHSLVVDEGSLPDCLEVTARTEDGVVMAIEHRTLPVIGLQFHPESILTEHGYPLLAAFLRLGGPPDADAVAGKRAKSLAEDCPILSQQLAYRGPNVELLFRATAGSQRQMAPQREVAKQLQDGAAQGAVVAGRHQPGGLLFRRKDLRRAAHLRSDDRHTGGRGLQKHATQRFLPGRMRQQRQLAKQPDNVAANAKKVNPPAQLLTPGVVQLAFKTTRFLLLGMPLADNQIMCVGRPVGDACGSAKKHVLPLAKPNLPDDANQLTLRGQPKLPMHVTGWRSRAELRKIDAVVNHVRFFPPPVRRPRDTRVWRAKRPAAARGS